EPRGRAVDGPRAADDRQQRGRRFERRAQLARRTARRADRRRCPAAHRPARATRKRARAGGVDDHPAVAMRSLVLPLSPFVLSLSKHRPFFSAIERKNGPSTSSGRTEFEEARYFENQRGFT